MPLTHKHVAFVFSTSVHVVRGLAPVAGGTRDVTPALSAGSTCPLCYCPTMMSSNRATACHGFPLYRTR